jgi:hypothetical protein
MFKLVFLLLNESNSFLANSILTGAYTEQQVQFGICVIHYFIEILRHYTRWTYISPNAKMFQKAY